MRTDYGYFEEKELGKPYDIRILRKLYPFSKPYKILLFCSILLVMIITLLDLSLPYVTKIAIDRYIVPAQHSVDSKSTGASEGKSRHLRVNILDTEIAEIVKKYNNLFVIDGTVAHIALDQLPALDKKDLYVLRKHDLTGIMRITAVFLLIIVLNFGLNFLQMLIMEYTGQMIMHDLRVRLFNHLQELSIAFFTRNPVGRLVTRVTNDVQNMNELFTSVIVFVFKDLFLLIGIAVVLLSINWKLALISFAVLPFVIYASIIFSGHAREVFRQLRIKVAEINTKISETLGGLRVIQLFGQEKENYRKFKQLNHENYLAGMRQIQITAVFMPAIEFLGVVSLAIVIFYGGSGVLKGAISLGALVAVISYVKMFFRPIRDIAEKYNILQNAMASAERIFLLLENEEKLPQAGQNMPAQAFVPGKIKHITFNEVSFGYVNHETVLKRISFEAYSGEVLAIVGPTGSGKTSLIQLLPRFYDPNAGQVLINGKDIKGMKKSVLRSKMALVMQDPFLFSGTVQDNIIYNKANMSTKELDYILEASNCKHLVDKLPDGLDTVLSQDGISLSSGERQLISIARAFAHNPDLILFDEATSYIDSETEHKIQEAMFNLMKNRTSIIVAHRLMITRNADRVIVLNRGRIVETGTYNELIQRKGFYYRLNQLQG